MRSLLLIISMILMTSESSYSERRVEFTVGQQIIRQIEKTDMACMLDQANNQHAYRSPSTISTTPRCWPSDHLTRFSRSEHSTPTSETWEEEDHSWYYSQHGHNVELSQNHDTALSQEWEEAEHFNLWSWYDHTTNSSQTLIEEHRVDWSSEWREDPYHNLVHSWEEHDVQLSQQPVDPGIPPTVTGSWENYIMHVAPHLLAKDAQ